jgi:hypothetical protein
MLLKKHKMVFRPDNLFSGSYIIQVKSSKKIILV